MHNFCHAKQLNYTEIKAKMWNLDMTVDLASTAEI